MYRRVSLALCLALLGYASFQYYPRWKEGGSEAVIGWDVAGYYWYLPSLFIYGDIRHQSFHEQVINKYQSVPDFKLAYIDSASGNYVLKYSLGTAVAMSPAFFIAHAIAPVKDGFSAPYQLAIQVEWVLLAIVGLFLLSYFLSFYFGDKVVALTLLLLVYGSNYLNWAAIDAGQTHSLLFTLYVALLLQTRAFYLKPSRLRGFFIGLTIGYMVLVRPSEMVSILIPLLWGIDRISAIVFRQRFAFIRQHYGAFLLALLAGLIAVSPQLIYWKYVTGRWLEYSYQDQGFSFLNPHLKDYTLDWAHGWLIQSPVMILAIVGILPFVKKGTNRLALLLFAILNYYIVASWDVWTYGGRAMIQSYPVLSVFIASFIAWISKPKWGKSVLILLCGFFIYYNVWWTYASHPGFLYPGGKRQTLSLLENEEMSNRYYMSVVGRWTAPSQDVHKLTEMKKIFTGVPRDMRLLYSTDTMLKVDEAHPMSAELKIPITAAGGSWIRIWARYLTAQREPNYWKMRIVTLHQYRKGELVDQQGVRIDRFIDQGGPSRFYLDILPDQPFPNTLNIHLNNLGSSIPLDMDSIRVFTFRE